MKKRDRFWVNRILCFLVIVLFYAIISFCNIVQFNNIYILEEKQELTLFKKQIEWAIKPFLEKKDFKTLQKYCNDFKNQDISFRIFDKNEKLLASTSNNTKELLSIKDYSYNKKDKIIGLVEDINIKNDIYYLELTVSQADVMQSITAARKSLLILSMICAVFFIIGLIQIFYTLRNSFNKLEDSVIEVANGNLEALIEVPRIGLLEELTLSIKKMTSRLKNQIARLSQLEQYKSNFLQNITHEIKTPITAINSAVELLQTKNTISETDKECFDIIQFQVKSINKLTNDILCLSEIEVEKTNEKKKFEKINLNSLVQEAIGNLNFYGVEINFIQNAQAFLLANNELILTALENIIVNAIKYSKTDKIDIILNLDSKIELIIKDYGIGIPLEHLEHIFERFYRVDKTRSRALGGTGLGLAIVKNIVELHNGTIDVESEINKGTTFKLSFVAA